MQVDFYHLTRDPAEKLVPILVEKSLEAETRVLLVSSQETQSAELSKALWSHDPSSFLAHNYAGSADEAHQPVLISDSCQAPNDAEYIILTDGQWREYALTFDRAFFLFTRQEIDGARAAWRELSAMEEVTPRYWKQDGGRWVEGP